MTKGTSTGNALGIGALLSILGANTEVPPAPGDVYSINTGNEWIVTPIFDPSGQAMRFKFDYNSSVRVREFDGTVNPLLPRIERHAVNTEVGLTNLEFGEVSRFETNSKIGLPDRRTGGVPLLKELPLLRDIPLVGYFARQRRQAAESQRSLIFAQTTMFPTVSDIVALMVAPGRNASTRGSLQRSEINPDDLFPPRN